MQAMPETRYDLKSFQACMGNFQNYRSLVQTKRHKHLQPGTKDLRLSRQ